jgi:HD-GYP domain-containing protein (c-di-GMP phosphodiesterase class II)
MAASRSEEMIMKIKKFHLSTEQALEISLVLIIAALASLLHQVRDMRLVVLHLFVLPIVLAGFYLGRYRAGAFALFSVAVATIIVSLDLGGFASSNSPLMIALAMTLWGATLGLTAILVGTLCDDRDAKSVEAHEAHVGVVEVLARYLQSANPRLESRAKRVAELSRAVAATMRLSPKEVDDIHVAALLADMENIEITARVIKKAFGELQADEQVEQRTIYGTELVRSLGAVLSGAFPLILKLEKGSQDQPDAEFPFGARIIRTVRAYVQLAEEPWAKEQTPHQVLQELRADAGLEHHPAVLHALETVIARLPDHGAEGRVDELEAVVA